MNQENSDKKNQLQKPLLDNKSEKMENPDNLIRRSERAESHIQTQKQNINIFDTFFKRVGNKNWYQIQLFAQFSLQALCASWFQTSIKFYFQEPEFQCPQNFQNQYDGKFQTCSEWVCNALKNATTQKQIQTFIKFDSFQGVTQDFELICDKEYLRYVLIGISQLFSILGLLFFGRTSDLYGRKQALQTCWKIFTIGYIIFPLVEEFPLFIIGYCMCSFSCYSALILQISLLNEATTGKVRQYLGSGLWLQLAFGQIIFVLLAYLIPNWQYLAIITGTIPVLLMNWVIKEYYESSRYYYPTNKLKAIQTLNKIAEINERKSLNIDLDKSTWVENWNSQKINHLILFKYDSLKKVTIPGFFMLQGLYFMYYGSEQEILLFGQATYTIQTLLITLTKFVGFGIVTYFIPKINRIQLMKILCAVSMVTQTIFYILLEVESKKDNNEWTPINVIAFILALLNRTISSMNIVISFIFAAEVFPTAVRSMGLSIQLSTQPIAFFSIYAIYGIFSDFRTYSVNDQQAKIGLWVTMAIMIFSAIITLTSLYFLKETKNETLQDEIQELAIAQHDNFVIKINVKNKNNKQQQKIKQN